jgi:hypothetical protein
MSFTRKILSKNGHKDPKSDVDYPLNELAAKRPRRKRHISVGALPFANRKLPRGMRPLGV